MLITFETKKECTIMAYDNGTTSQLSHYRRAIIVQTKKDVNYFRKKKKWPARAAGDVGSL
jgi:hypothetical protein